MQTRRELNLIWFGCRLMDFDSIMLRNTGLQLIGLVAWGCCRRTDPVVPIVDVPQSLLNGDRPLFRAPRDGRNDLLRPGSRNANRLK